MQQYRLTACQPLIHVGGAPGNGTAYAYTDPQCPCASPFCSARESRKRVICIGLLRDRRRNLHGKPPKRINLPPLTGTLEIVGVLAYLLPLAVVCKHSSSPDQTHQPPGSDGARCFRSNMPDRVIFTHMWCYKTRKGPPRTMALGVFLT